MRANVLQRVKTRRLARTPESRNERILALKPQLFHDYVSGNDKLNNINVINKLTTTRTSSGSYTNTAGTVSAFSTNTARIGDRGLLVTRQATNLVTYSDQLTATGWVYPTAVGAPSADSVVAPDGTTTADLFYSNGRTNANYITCTVIASTAYAFSFYVKLGTMSASDFKFAVYNATGAAFIASDIVPSTTPNSSGWTRVKYTFTSPSGCTSVRVYPFRNSATITTGSYALWGVQLEANDHVTELVYTTGATAARQNDTVTINDFSTWFSNSGSGSFFIEWEGIQNAVEQCLFCVDNGSTSNAFRCSITSGTTTSQFRVGGYNSSSTITFSPDFGYSTNQETTLAVNRAVISWSGSTVTLTYNGTSKTFTGSLAIPTNFSRLIFGQGGFASLRSAMIRKFAYYPKVLSSSEAFRLTR